MVNYLPETAANSLAEVRTYHRLLESFPAGSTPNSVEDAYRVQDTLVHQLGGNLVGWKIGCTSKLAQEMSSTDQPFYGRMFSATTHDSPGKISFEDVFSPIVEPEIAFRFGEELLSHGGPFGVEEVSEAVDAIYPAVEIVDCRYAGGWPIPIIPTIVDNGVHAAFILGQELEDWSSVDRPGIRVSVEVNGDFVTDGVGANALDDPLNALVWLANSCTARGHNISKGDLVTTGNTANKAIYGKPGDSVVVLFGGLGEVEVRFD